MENSSCTYFQRIGLLFGVTGKRISIFIMTFKRYVSVPITVTAQGN